MTTRSPTWEYLVLAATDHADALNELGADGWELVLCVPYTGGFKFIFRREATTKR